MFGFLLLLAPVAHARLGGFLAAEPLPTVSCGKAAAAGGCGGGDGLAQSAAAEPADEGFDELTLLQQEMEPVEGMHKKTVEEWLEHWEDHKTKISADQRVLHNETVASQLAKIDAGICEDDPMWRDGDGDGCDIYKFAISSGRMTQDIACNGGGQSQPAPGLRGAPVKVAADATAKVFCPVTCGMCRKPVQLEQEAAIDEAASESLDDVTFLQVGVSSSTGAARKSTKFWEQHIYDHATRITADQRVLDNTTVAEQLKTLDVQGREGRACVDDTLWRDADGDGCEIYKFAIESGKTSREVVCNGGGEQDSASPRLRGSRELVVADATAKVFCPVTCGIC